MKKLSFFCLLLFPLFSASAEPLEAPVDSSQPSEHGSIDSIHDHGMSTLAALTDDIDNFFGDIRSEEEKKNDWFRIGTEVGFRSSSPIRIRERLRANIDLSPYGESLRFFVEGDSADRYDRGHIVEGTSENDDFVDQYRGDSASTGLKYDFFRDSRNLVVADLGFKFTGGPHLFSDIRASHWYSITDKLSSEVTQYLQWIDGDGYGEKTRLDINYLLHNQDRLRARTEALYSQSSRGTDLLEELSWLRKFTDRTSAGFALSLTAYTDPSWTPDVYRAAFRYRQLVYGNFLYLETEPGFEFTNDEQYKATPYVLFKIDMYFDR